MPIAAPVWNFVTSNSTVGGTLVEKHHIELWFEPFCLETLLSITLFISVHRALAPKISTSLICYWPIISSKSQGILNRGWFGHYIRIRPTFHHLSPPYCHTGRYTIAALGFHPGRWDRLSCTICPWFQPGGGTRMQKCWRHIQCRPMNPSPPWPLNTRSWLSC